MVFGAHKPVMRLTREVKTRNENEMSAAGGRLAGGEGNAFGARNWWRLAVTAFNLANRSSVVTVPPSETVKHQQFINMDIRHLCSTSLSLYPSAARHPCTSNCMNVVVVVDEMRIHNFT